MAIQVRDQQGNKVNKYIKESLTKVNNYHFKDGCIPIILNIDCVDIIKISNGYVFTETNESIELNKLCIEELIEIVDCINI